MFSGFFVLGRGLIRKISPLLTLQKQQYTAYTYSMTATEAKQEQCTHLVWMDLEMTGLDVRKDTILEIACLITDKNLNIIGEGISLPIKQHKKVLDQMDEWCLKQHTKSGLVQKCLESQITIDEAERILLKFLQENVPAKQCPLAGNSVYIDRLFLRMEMPQVDEYLHYRIVDVSTIKELFKRWHPQIAEAILQKKCNHRSLDDIKESIAELTYYRKYFVGEKDG